MNFRHLEKESWEVAVAECVYKDYRHSWEYANLMANEKGARAEFVAIDVPHGHKVLAQVRIKALPLLKIGLAYISGGLLDADCLDSEDCFKGIESALPYFVYEYVKRRGFLLRISLMPLPFENTDRISRLYESNGFRQSASVPCYRTIILDLSFPADILWKNLRPRCRTYLRRSMETDISIFVRDDRHAIEEILPAFEEISQRKKIPVKVTAEFYNRVQRRSQRQDRYLTISAKKENRLLGGLVLSVTGRTAVYLVGTTANEGLQYKIGNRLHWEAMHFAARAGCRWYDLGGIDVNRDPGGYQFKSGFRGFEVSVPGPYEFYPSKQKRYICSLLEKAYSKYLVMKKR